MKEGSFLSKVCAEKSRVRLWKKLLQGSSFILVLSQMSVATPSENLSHVAVEKTSSGWMLTVNGHPYFVRGICYTPVKVGESPDSATQRDWMVVDEDGDGRVDVAYQSWVDANRNNRRDPEEKEVGDFTLLEKMGCNTLRLYHHSTSNLKIQKLYEHQQTAALLFNHRPNKDLLRELYSKHGIRVVMGDLLGAYGVGSGVTGKAGTDYSDTVQKENMLTSVEDMVREFKDEPFLLFWVLGNENNLFSTTRTNAAQNPKEYARFIQRVVKRMKELDPHHPVCLSQGDDEAVPLSVLKKHAPAVDIIGFNSFRSPNFGDLWKDVAQEFDRPVCLTEYGISHPKIVNGHMDELDQAMRHRQAAEDISAHQKGGVQPRNSIGGFAYEWLDNWWQNGEPNSLNVQETVWNNELTGLASQGDGTQSPLLRQLRLVYFEYQKIWKQDGGRP